MTVTSSLCELNKSLLENDLFLWENTQKVIACAFISKRFFWEPLQRPEDGLRKCAALNKIKFYHF